MSSRLPAAIVKASLAASIAAALTILPAAAVADVPGLYTTRTAFEDVLFELDTAILARGLAVHSAGNQFAAMLERTGPVVGSTKPVFKQATFVEVCSARQARAMVEADPTLMGNCPFVIFVYEHVDTPGQVTVGFRRLMRGQSAAAGAAVDATEAMLDAIARQAAK